MVEILYPEEKPMVKKHSSIDQFKGFLSVYKQGGWSPIVFDQLDGIKCETVKTHPVIVSWGGDLGYVFPEARCSYASDKFVYFDKEGVEQRALPAEFGGGGELYDTYIKSNSFVNFDDGSSLGVHNDYNLRVGTDYAVADEALPAVE